MFRRLYDRSFRSDSLVFVRDLFGGRWRAPSTRKMAVKAARVAVYRETKPFALVAFGLVLAKLLGLG